MLRNWGIRSMCYPIMSAGTSPPALTGISGSRERERMDRIQRTMDWNVTTMDWNLRTMEWNVTTMDRNLRTMDRSLTDGLGWLSNNSDYMTLSWRVYGLLLVIQAGYYPILAIVGVPANSVTIVKLSKGKCGLSKCVTCYPVAMAAADLLDSDRVPGSRMGTEGEVKKENGSKADD
ncbi:uncharacterized protein LOC144668988 isoform X1 [Cetorhinus maximus]